ncbi:MAG: hypothetical protein RIS25_533 [Actinomycetota bacterium]|jgi:pyrroline-5-carboxylate reductase
METTLTFAFLGTGSMNGAILAGLLNEGSLVGSVRATTRSMTSAEALSSGRVEARSVESNADANRWAVTGADVVVLGVKPAGIVDVLADIRDAVSPDALIISVAAGVTLETMQSVVSNPVVRAMPNTPALVGLGVTGVAPADNVSAANRLLARRVFETVGVVMELPESQIDALSTISGSGPAYVFHAIEQWTLAAERLGFTLDEARRLVEGTFVGSTRLLQESGVNPAELRRRVTSPKGTTERAIAVLDAAQLADIYEAAARAALARAAEIAAENASKH